MAIRHPGDIVAIRHPADVDSLTHVFVGDLAAPTMAPADSHHVNRVLRGRPGEVVTAGDGLGSFRVCRLDGTGDLVSESDVIEVVRRDTELTMAFALLKGDKNDSVVQKLTELGVDRIIPFSAANSVAQWDHSKWVKNSIRFNEIARHAAMQCRRPWLPAIGLPGLVGGASFVDVSQLAGVAWARRGGRAIDKSHTCIAIGPEGGWSAGEQALMDISVGIFDEVLRAETAAVVAAALMANFRNQP